jgi:hypothetical protein
MLTKGFYSFELFVTVKTGYSSVIINAIIIDLILSFHYDPKIGVEFEVNTVK